jgi:hypothetical protein
MQLSELAEAASASGVGVSSGGTGVGLAGTAVSVGGGMSVGGTGVGVGGTGVSVGGMGVGRGGSGVVVAGRTATAVGSTVGVALLHAFTPQPEIASTARYSSTLTIRTFITASFSRQEKTQKGNSGGRHIEPTSRSGF